jgi:predicted nucleic acid-binding protein
VVVDTSVAVKWFFDEPYSAQAFYLLDAFRQGRFRPLAPDLIYPEFANVVWKRVAPDRLSPEAGAAAITTFLALPIEITPSPVLLVPAYRLALEHEQSVYDALFLALSLDAGADLVTADEALYQTVRPHFPQVRWLGNWPAASGLPV